MYGRHAPATCHWQWYISDQNTVTKYQPLQSALPDTLCFTFPVYYENKFRNYLFNFIIFNVVWHRFKPHPAIGSFLKFNILKNMSHLCLLRFHIKTVIFLRCDLDRHTLFDLDAKILKPVHLLRIIGEQTQRFHAQIG